MAAIVAAAAVAVELAPGVVVSADRSTAYLMAPGGGVEAVALDRGEPLWRSDEADRPLGLAAGRPVAQIEPSASGAALRLAVLDAATGEVARAAIEISLPPGVRPRIEDALGEEFRLDARATGSELVLEWSFVERPVTGVSPLPGEPPAVRRLAGGARVDPVAGVVTPLAPGELVADGPPPAVGAALDAAAAAPPAWRAEGVWAALEPARETGGVLRLGLRRWTPGGDELPPIELFRGRAAGALPAADGRHVLVGTPAEPGSRAPWIWRLYAVEDGQLAGSLPAESSLASFLLTATGVVHLAEPVGRRVGGRWVEMPLRLRAAGLEDGAERWTRPVRDVAFRGLRPPGG